MLEISIGLATLLIFGSLMLLLALGVPFAFAIGSVALIFTFLLWGPNGLNIVATQTLGTMRSTVLLALPLFYLMANFLQNSGIADSMYELIYAVMGRVRGGLAAGTVFICMIFAAMAGISGAATVSMGLIALPSMLKRNYDKSIAIGCICAGGALGILIPPSVTMIIYGVLAGVSVGRLFAGGILPGILLGSLFIAYVLIRCHFQPNIGPTIPAEEQKPIKKILPQLRSLILPIFLIMAVLGSIFSGIATPTEAAGVGALGAIICSMINRSFNLELIKKCGRETLRLTAMVLWIATCAAWLSSLYSAIGGLQFLQDLIQSHNTSPWTVLISIQVLLILLGMIMETNGIIFITVPIFLPIIKMLGFDPVWFGVLFIVNMEMGLLTPPFGLNLFYIRGIAPKEISMRDIYGSVAPFVLLQLIGLIIVMLFPSIVTFIPDLLFSR